MNYKVGDKVIYNGNVQIVKKVPDAKLTISDVGYLDKDYVELDLWFDNAIYYKDIEPYKTPHEKLLELGYEYIPHCQGHRYKHKEDMDVIDIDLIRSSFYHFRYISVKKIEPCGTKLELSKILTQYLEEMEE